MDTLTPAQQVYEEAPQPASNGTTPQEVQAPQPTEKAPLLVRKVGTKDIGWLNRIFVKARNEVRRMGRAGELDELGYEKDENGNYLGIGFQEMIDIAFPMVEKDLNAWTADLTGKSPEVCAEDVSILFGVIDEMEAGGYLSPLFNLLMKLQGRQVQQSGQTSSTGESDTSSQ